ncbi:MAG: hypothetical protein N4A45_07245 [Flavobacteriales bacterium]|jgi:hypothetical protein|nr:hypothetical protein [Flavobacteriales bacterium]
MRYYLETNALYSIEKICAENKKNLFTSIFSLYELVSGIKKDNFNRRKNILNKVKNSNIFIDREMPEKKIFDSFDITANYDYLEERVEPLMQIIDNVLSSESFEIFSNNDAYRTQKYNFDYFKNLDNTWSKGFIENTIKGNKWIKDIVQNGENEFNFNGINYKIDKNRDLDAFFTNEKISNQSFTIYALGLMIKDKGIDSSDMEIYESYNRLITDYIHAFSKFCANKMVTHNSPATNDFTDLTHLLYLKSTEESMIVSDDSIYDNFSNKKRISVDELIQTNANNLV